MQITGKTAILVLILGLSQVLTQDDPYRLPPNYIVDHYDIDLVIPTEALSGGSTNYTGYVEITFQVTVNTSEVKLHAAYGNITLLSIQLDDAEALTSDSYSVNSTTNILTLNFPSELIVGESHVLKFDFEAHLFTSSGNSLYRAQYTDSDDNVQYLAATQFESTYARYAFPCFDEPGYKSTFAYKLTYPSEFLALTNTPEINSTIDNSTGLTTTQFGTSPPMPVYLVAFTIAKYTCSEGYLEGSDQYIYRICSRPDKEYMRNYTMMLTPLVIENFNSYTGINYTQSLSKLDEVAVSGKSGAMENWGLVLYRESGLLFDNTVQTNTDLQSILAVVSHELAHQWFGNLVTCKWWSETFLNEGFATLFEYYIADESQPEFQMKKMLVTSRIHSIMVTDAGSNVPALGSNASTPSEISAKFNSYSYRKGAGVLRMAEHIIGRDVFKEGINKYLTDNQYQSVEPQDVWDALEAVSEKEITVFPTGTNLSEIMYNWIYKAGFPVVNVTLNGSTIVMSQQRFLSSGTDTSGNTWYIPISYSTAELDNTNEITTPRGWITTDDDFVIEEFTNSSAWIVVNNQEMGFYRVNYDTVLWNNLATALKAENFSGIHVLNRAQVVDDSDRLSRAEYITIGQALKNTEFLAEEESYFVWYPAITFFGNLLTKTGSISPLGAALTQHFLELVEKVAVSVPLTTVNETAHIFTINQVLINNYACKYGSPTCIAGAKEVFSTYKSTYERPNINTRSIIYCNAIRHSDDPVSDWEFLYEQYQNESVSSDTSTIWSALGCATNTTVLRSFLSKVLENDTVITSSLYTSTFSTIYSANEVGVDFVLDYFIENYQAIIDKYNSSGLSNVQTIITGLGSVFTREDQIEKLENFVSTNEDLPTVIATAAASAISTYRSNQQLVESHKPSLYGYFGLSDEDATTVTTPSTASPTTIQASTTTQETTTSSIETTTSSSYRKTLATTGLVSLLIVTCNFVFVN